MASEQTQMPGRAESGAQSEYTAGLVEVEIHALVRAVSPYGVLSREALAEACHVEHWQPGRFQHALQAAVRTGRLRHLGLGFYASPPPQRLAG